MRTKFGIKKLKPLHNNPRSISKENFERLKRDILDDPEFLDKRPLLVNHVDNEYIVYAGNMRLKACLELGWTEVPVDIDESLELTTMRKRALRDNVEYGETDYDILANEWEDLVTSMDLPELQLPTTEGEVYEDNFEKPKEAKYTVVKGDIYQLGDHRLMCGSSTELNDVEKLMNGEKADMVFTDPPFNLVYGGTGKHNKFKDKFIDGDGITDEEFIKFLEDYNANIKVVLKEVGTIYEWMDWRQISKLYEIMKKYFHIDQVIVWDKTFIKLGGNYRNQHELLTYALNADINDGDTPYVSITDQCIYAKNNKKIAKWYGDRKQSNIWYKITDATVNYVHPTQKPIELPAKGIRNSSEIGDIVLDTFGGSGSTLIASEQLGRKCYMMELDPYYCSVIIERWENLTGKEHIKL